MLVTPSVFCFAVTEGVTLAAHSRKLTVDISLLWQRRWHGEAVTEDWK